MENKNLDPESRDDMKISETDIVMFLADQEDMREQGEKFSCHGSIYKTLVEPRPTGDSFEDSAWDAYVVIDGMYYHMGAFSSEKEASDNARINNIRLEKMAKEFISEVVIETMTQD